MVYLPPVVSIVHFSVSRFVNPGVSLGLPFWFKRRSWTIVEANTAALKKRKLAFSTCRLHHFPTHAHGSTVATHTHLLQHSKTSWLRLTVPPSASTSAPPTPASASGSTTGTSLRRFFPSHFAFPPPPRDRRLGKRARSGRSARVEGIERPSSPQGVPLNRNRPHFPFRTRR